MNSLRVKDGTRQDAYYYKDANEYNQLPIYPLDERNNITQNNVENSLTNGTKIIVEISSNKEVKENGTQNIIEVSSNKEVKENVNQNKDGVFFAFAMIAAVIIISFFVIKMKISYK